MIQVTNVSKVYGGKKVVDNVSVTIPKVKSLPLSARMVPARVPCCP